MTWCSACETDGAVVGGRCADCGEPTSAPDTRPAFAVARKELPTSARVSSVVVALIVAGAFVVIAFVSVLVKVAIDDPSTRPTIQLSDYVDLSTP
jgi:hypothetical protein